MNFNIITPELISSLTIDRGILQGAIILIISILLARIAPLPRNMQPIVWFGILAKKLSKRTSHNNCSAFQQIIAGILSSLLLLLPFFALALFLTHSVGFPWIFEFIILYICLNDANFKLVAEEVCVSIAQKDKLRARALLHPWLTRNTFVLSFDSLSKATIEKLITAPVYGVVATIAFYSLGGAPLVLLARMIKQLELTWPCFNPKYQYFGRSSYLIGNIVFFIPTLLWSFSLAIQGGPQSLLTFVRPRVKGVPRGYIYVCEIGARVLNIELSGPMTFGSNCIALPKIKYGPVPDHHDIKRAILLTSTAFTFWILSLIIIPAIWALLRYLQ
ncbi:cobalamin biosynthesis protein [Shewanella surugensis]|uniref:Cobalamin biosynthesis protein n=1 Tax=Shewanella surugensis TaxID=212020 RepID=A0ABT0L608_9GAMM|nr:cobalamin biosynthesis protein [Shewanella surugensis]MCL1123127.1 cobalamin biosynthesis protein [Shewanella surugensis]